MRIDGKTVNLHTHTLRCGHAQGTEREYVECAIRAGFRELGFSDHSPYLFPEGYVSGCRMKPEEAEGYFRTLTDLREEYKDEIRIRIGLEMEYYPAHFEETLRFLSDYPVEYLILGQHYLYNEYDGGPCCRKTDDPLYYRTFIGQVIRGLDTGKYLYAAHPDMLCFTGDEGIFREETHRLCRHAAEREIPLEINLLGIRGGRHYPDPRFWEIAGQEGVSVVIGADAHRPGDVWNEDAWETAMGLIDRYSLRWAEFPFGIPEK